MSLLTGVQLGGLIRQRRYDASVGRSVHAISLDGGASWWEFFLDGREFAIGELVDRNQIAREEWNPTHSGLSYSVIEVNPEAADARLVVSFGFSESRFFVFRVNTRPIQLMVIDRDGNEREVGTSDGETLESVEYLGRVEEMLPNWRREVQHTLR